jgi:hypothetical protein
MSFSIRVDVPFLKWLLTVSELETSKSSTELRQLIIPILEHRKEKLEKYYLQSVEYNIDRWFMFVLVCSIDKLELSNEDSIAMMKSFINIFF